MLAEDRRFIWKIADYTRELLALSTPLSLNALSEAIKALGGTCEVVPDLSDGEACISTPNGQDCSPKFNIRYIENKPESRVLFSIAHELGHLILHLLDSDGTIKECTTLHRSAQSTLEELEANEFAAALLMPADAFIAEVQKQVERNSNHNVNIAELANYFHVSVQAATVRGKILQLW